MKKLYFTALIALLYLPLSNACAQDACPGPNPPAVRNLTMIASGQQVCVVFVENMIPNAPVTLFGPDLVVIPSASGTPVITDDDGFASYVYACNQTPERVATCNLPGCCTSLVPPAAALPVKLTKFVVRLQNESLATLDWTSAFEVNSSRYIIERSGDGRNFESVGSVAAAGNSSHAINYNYVDHLPVAGAYYYRLKQIDLDAKSENSRVVYVNSKKGLGTVTKIFPNPFQSEIQIIGITSADLNPNSIRVFTATGQRVNFAVSGANAIILDGLAPRGIYILEVKGQRFKLIRN